MSLSLPARRRSLHSFPTRRSSDLAPRTSLKDGLVPTIGYFDKLLVGTRRSEEHTSELQSRQYLVCRLLPEKKRGEPHRHAAGRIDRHHRARIGAGFRIAPAAFLGR